MSDYCCAGKHREEIFKLEITREGLNDLARLLHSAGYPVRVSYRGNRALISGWRASVPPPPPPPEPHRRIR